MQDVSREANRASNKTLSLGRSGMTVVRALYGLHASVLVLSGCAGYSSQTYQAGDVGTVIETTRGEIISSRLVEIEGTSTGKGLGVGFLVGAVALGPLGAFVGTAVGHHIEKQSSSGEGIEYIVDVEDDRTITLVQDREPEEPALPDGTPILMQVSYLYTRVIPDPRTSGNEPVEPLPSDEWIDPDKLRPTATTELSSWFKTGGEPG